MSERVFYTGYWWGGGSYAYRTDRGYLEAYASLDEAKRVLQHRYESNGKRACFFNYVNRSPETCLLPTVTSESVIRLYRGFPDDDDQYPDYEIRFGSHGTVTVTRL